VADLRISADLDPWPLDAVTSTFGILAIKGAGKSYTASVLAEEMIGAGLQTVVHDPTGAWWGLRSGADGKSAGLPVVILGGDHGDLPLDEHAGARIADLVVDGDFSLVLDTSGFETKASVIRFMLAFLRRLYFRNREPLHVFLDEADEIAPQTPHGEDAKLLGAVEQLVRRGRIKGLGCTLITQRSAVLNKNVLTQIETLIALRTISPQDRGALDDWIKAKATGDERARVLGSLAELENGEAWVWSPSLLKLLERVRIRKRRTFDSGATPKVGEKRREPKALTPVDVEAIRVLLADVIERAEAEDPAALQKRIAELEAELDRVRAEVPEPPPPERVEVPVLAPEVEERFGRTIEELRQLSEAIAVAFGRVKLPPPFDLANLQLPRERPLVEFRAKPSTPKPANRGHAEAGEGAPLVKGAREMLRALASMRRPLSRTQVATLAGMSPNSGTFAKYLGRLRADGLVTADGSLLAITPAGLERAGDVPRPSSTSELRQLWGAQLVAGARNMLDVLIAEYPRGVARAVLAERAELSGNSGTFAKYLGKLVKNGLAERRGGEIVASSTLFVGGRR
jgi:uncharacterized protein